VDLAQVITIIATQPFAIVVALILLLRIEPRLNKLIEMETTEVEILRELLRELKEKR